jgi:uncharacterized membrane protein
MAWDWRDRPLGERVVSWVRLPLQFVFVWVAWQIARRSLAPAARRD